MLKLEYADTTDRIESILTLLRDQANGPKIISTALTIKAQINNNNKLQECLKCMDILWSISSRNIYALSLTMQPMEYGEIITSEEKNTINKRKHLKICIIKRLERWPEVKSKGCSSRRHGFNSQNPQGSFVTVTPVPAPGETFTHRKLK